MKLVKYCKHYKHGIEYSMIDGELRKIKFYFIDIDDKSNCPAVYTIIFRNTISIENNIMYPAFTVSVESFGMPLKDFDSYIIVDPWIVFNGNLCRTNMNILKKDDGDPANYNEIKEYLTDLIFYLSLTLGKEIVYLLNYTITETEVSRSRMRVCLELDYNRYFGSDNITTDMEKLESLVNKINSCILDN